MDNIPFSDLRAKLAETLSNLDARTEPLFIARRGRRTAVLLSVPQYEALVKKKSVDDGPAARLAAWRAEYRRSMTRPAVIRSLMRVINRLTARSLGLSTLTLDRGAHRQVPHASRLAARYQHHFRADAPGTDRLSDAAIRAISA